MHFSERLETASRKLIKENGLQAGMKFKDTLTWMSDAYPLR